MKTSKHIAKTITEVKELNKQDILTALNLPLSADVFITIPGGGDYSNMDLDISKEMPLKIRIVTRTTVAE